jgi:hypothetical protein
MKLYSKGMTGLTRIAIIARKSIRYGIYGIIAISLGKILLDAGIGLYNKIFPAPPPPPTVKFGRLTKIPFPVNETQLKISYTLETPEGGLPKDLPDQAKVFFMPKSNANLLALDVSKEMAKALGFSSEPVQLSDTLYKFTNPNFPSEMEVNIVTGAFSISYDLNADRTPIDSRPKVAEVAASEFRAMLSNANVLPEDLTGATTHDFFKLTNQGLTPALSLSEADVVKVNLFRKEYDDLPSVTAKPTEANVWAIIGGSTNKDQKIVASEYHYHPVDESQFSTYPIKAPEDAYSELQAGGAYVADPGLSKDGDTLKIRRVYLAYFDPEAESDFFQPVFVFEGDNGYTAYVPAITSDYYGQ